MEKSDVGMGCKVAEGVRENVRTARMAYLPEGLSQYTISVDERNLVPRVTGKGV